MFIIFCSTFHQFHRPRHRWSDPISTIKVCDVEHTNCHWCNGPDCRTGHTHHWVTGESKRSRNPKIKSWFSCAAMLTSLSPQNLFLYFDKFAPTFHRQCGVPWFKLFIMISKVKVTLKWKHHLPLVRTDWPGCQSDWLIDRSIDRLIDWSIDWLIDWLIDWPDITDWPGCQADANCPMERPICGPSASDGSGSDSGGGSDSLGGGSNSLEGDSRSGSEDEFHRCGCSSDSDCFDLEATLPDNLTAICEGNVCVEGCRWCDDDDLDWKFLMECR